MFPQQPQDDVIYEAVPVLPGPAPSPPPTVPFEKDRWYVLRLDGSRHGPMKWKDLVGCLTAKMFGGEDLVQGDHHPRCTLRQLFPTYFATTPFTAGEIQTLPSGFDQFMSNPLQVAVFGAEMHPFQKSDPSGVYRGQRIFIAAAVGMAWLLCLATYAVVAFFHSGEVVFATVVLWVFASFFFTAGYFGFSAALLEWDFFFRAKKAKGMRGFLGDQGARRFYIGFGSLIMLATWGFYTSIVVSALTR